MAFAGEGIVTEGNNGLGCAEDRANGETDSNNRSRVAGNVALKQVVSSSDLSTHRAWISDVSY